MIFFSINQKYKKDHLSLRKLMPMTIAILADEQLKQEWNTKKLPENIEVIWADSVRSLLIIEADVYIDLLFEMDAERTSQLKKLLLKPVIVNAVAFTTKSIDANFIRINAWPTLLQRSITEIAVRDGFDISIIAYIFDQLQWQYQVVPDIAGMITARVIAMIINEAYFTLGAEVSSKEEIDTAMKLGTNYPYGPFEWSGKIGLKRIYELLKELSRTDARYAVAPSLEKDLH
jgi:3-hydroxybutyryl-CoA dehydrogenase